VSSFEKFLKENVFTVANPELLTSGKDVVGVKDLGEWAWEKVATAQKWRGKDFRNWIGCRSPYFKIAIACLGRKEIEKRLEKMQRFM